MKRIFGIAVLFMFAAMGRAQEQPAATLTVSPSPAVVGTSVALTARAANLVSLAGVSVRFEALLNPESGKPVAEGTPGAVWGQIGNDAALNSRMSAEMRVDTTNFGVGIWPVRARIVRAGATDLVATADLTVSGQ